VLRGPAPQEAQTWTHYGDASRQLSDAIGFYCSYCEVPLKSASHVEHKLPKLSHPQHELEWDNFLIGCPNCNAIKGSFTYAVGSHVWPDRDNTSIAFVYLPFGMVEVAEGLVDPVDLMAEATNQMVGLDRLPDTGASDHDLRWLHRKNAWDVALRQQARLAALDTNDARETIVDLAVATGFWSVWMTVFTDDQDMRSRLIDAFPGTAVGCFDDRTTCPVPRDGGVC
jgi:hypothetical protein